MNTNRRADLPICPSALSKTGRLWPIIGVACLITGAASPTSLRNFEPGPYPVRTIDRLTVRDATHERDVTMRLLYPDGSGPFPVVVFSAGAFCYPQMYDRIAGHWASHGYVVILPNHLDSPNNAARPTPDQYADFMPSRLRDASFILDAIADIGAHAGIEDKMDSRKAAIAGHSFGAVIAMVKTGMHVKPEYLDSWSDSWGDSYDDRFAAAVLLSAPGPGMPQMADNAFDGLRKPLIATGGTNDVGRIDIGDIAREDWRRQAFLLAPAGDKYALITAGSDHYLGGLICNAELGGEPDPEAVAMIRAVTTTFLDAYVKRDTDALDYLTSADITALTNGKASYGRR